jgi:hypothetical protein
VEKTGKKRPWKSQERFPLSHSFNNNKLDDRDHFQQNAKTSVASLRGLIGSSRNIDRHHSGMLIGFIGIPISFIYCHLRHFCRRFLQFTLHFRDSRQFGELSKEKRIDTTCCILDRR